MATNSFLCKFLSISLLLISTGAQNEPNEDMNDCVLFCYYTPSDRTEEEMRITPAKLPSPQPCTHLVYGFARD